MPANISSETFNGEAVWQTLTREQQDEIGAAALELVVAWFCMQESQDGGPFQTPESRAADAAVEAADRALEEAFCEAVLQAELTDGEDLLKFPSVLGMICRTCGCSHRDPCDQGCGWAEPGLCTECAGSEASDRTPADVRRPAGAPGGEAADSAREANRKAEEQGIDPL